MIAITTYDQKAKIALFEPPKSLTFLIYLCWKL